MPSKKKPEPKKEAPKKAEKKTDPLFQATPRNFRVGGDIRPTRDLSRFVKWPRYVRLQRQKKILKERLKIPPALFQFQTTLDKNQATELFKLLVKYQPEDKAAKADRLKGLAEAKAAGKSDDAKSPPNVVKFGLKHVTYLVESKKAKMVCIASDVDPIELVVWLPALCKKMDVPYVWPRGLYGRVAATPRLPRGSSAETSRGDAAAAARIVPRRRVASPRTRRLMSRRGRGRRMDIPPSARGAAAAAGWIFRRALAAPPRPGAGYSAERSRRRRGRGLDISPSARGAAAGS